MKIGGPKAPKPTGSANPEGPQAPPGQRQVGFDQLLAEVTTADAAHQVRDAVDASAASSAIQTIATQLKAGDITSTKAAELLVETVVAARGAHLTPALRQRLHQGLLQLLDEDPTLSNMVRTLERGD